MKKTVSIILLALGAACSSRAQSVGPSIVNSAGGTAVIGTNEYDWSVGEMTMVSTFTTSSVIVTQGLLQPLDAPSGVANNSLLAKLLQVFPNPASSIVNIEYSSPSDGSLTYRLTDVAGKEIKNSTIKVTQGKNMEQVNVSELPDATYMLVITANSASSASESVSFKIEKLN